jgi:hypothetical protein
MTGVILMTDHLPDVGTLWHVTGEAGAKHVYQFTGTHFEYSHSSTIDGGAFEGQ